MGRRSKYDSEFKRNAIALANEDGRKASEVEKSLGLSQGHILKWKKQLNKEGDLAFPGNGIEALTPEQKKIRDLEKQVKDLEMDKEILKKVISIFS